MNSMPGFYGTGPQGEGSLTGSRQGYCGLNERGTFINFHRFRRNVHGFGPLGRRRGWRNQLSAAGHRESILPSREQEIAELNSLADQLKAQLDIIEKRIETLNK
jgi:hypothetical protein